MGEVKKMRQQPGSRQMQIKMFGVSDHSLELSRGVAPKTHKIREKKAAVLNQILGPGDYAG